jgi:hypothetical protein
VNSFGNLRIYPQLFFSHFGHFWAIFHNVWSFSLILGTLSKGLGLNVFQASGDPAAVLVKRSRANAAGKVKVQVSVLFPGYGE